MKSDSHSHITRQERRKNQSTLQRLNRRVKSLITSPDRIDKISRLSVSIVRLLELVARLLESFPNM